MRLVPLSSIVLWVACGGSAPVHHASAALQSCVRNTTPGSISETIDRLNDLPRPVTPACFLASVPRPLSIVSTTGTTSAQPAAGRDDPRVFILTPGLVFSVVSAGEGAALIELGEWTTPRRTVKAEVKFPLTEALPASAPFERTKYTSQISLCGVCHAEETAHPTIAGAWVSLALQPAADSLVPLDHLRAQHEHCVTTAESTPRCELFHALFDFGEVRAGAFDADVARMGQ